MSLTAFLRRYSVVIIFPTLSIGSIAADYSYTRKWKRSLQNQQQQLTSGSQQETQ